ncbi:MAG: DEAD/DEAH box helicase [Spartobacteria bacterium]|nr:DEAD/DEAH box helicase [Spartobacteria bacterium]
MGFDSLGLNAELVRAVDALGFKEPMPIQEKSIGVLLEGERDFVGLAQTGTGKTGAYGLALIQHMDLDNCRTQGIVICPTRELCLQITEDLKGFSQFIDGLRVIPVYGGASIDNQIKHIKKGAQIIVATPGRLLDLMRRKAVNLSGVSFAVLDEADEMLNMGFQEDIDTILSTMPEHRKIWLFSATMPRGVAAIARNYLSDPVEVTVGNKNESAANIRHVCYTIREKDRYNGLKRIIDFEPEMFGLIFCRTRKETQTVAEALMHDGYQAEALHGDLSQTQRDYVMRKFRSGAIRMLVATDVAARGLDVDDITHVIHYKIPDDAPIYTHRSGRTARAGKSGVSIALISIKERHRIRELERRGNITFEFGEVPDGSGVCERQLYALVEKVVNTDVNEKEIAPYLPAVYAMLESLDKEEIIKRFVSAEFNRFFEYYRHTADINVKTHTRPDRQPAQPRHGKHRTRGPEHRTRGPEHRAPERGETQRFTINVGRQHKINKGAIVRLICAHSGIQSNMIGVIDMSRDKSFFEVGKNVAGQVRKGVNKAMLDGRPVQVQEVTPRGKNGTGKN